MTDSCSTNVTAQIGHWGDGWARILTHRGRVSNSMTTERLDQALLDGVRAARQAFARELEPLREPLFRYCRRLTGNLWEAEDLLQETYVRAFSRAADSHRPIERPLAWLVRIATNAYIDSRRRPAPLPMAAPDVATPEKADPAEVRDALAEVTTLLAPQERAAVVLKNVFDLSLAEIAAMIGTSAGAVKAALHRGRSKLDGPARYVPKSKPDRKVVDALAEAFTAYDLDRLTALFLTDGVSDVIGTVYEVGRESIGTGSLHHTLLLETDVRYRAEVRDLDGEPIVLLWAAFDDGGPDAVRDVLRVETADGGVSRLRWYYFCPEVLEEIGERCGVPVRTM
jgi:RNA polymerase sigma-70 factor, ECF subfamily